MTTKKAAGRKTKGEKNAEVLRDMQAKRDGKKAPSKKSAKKAPAKKKAAVQEHTEHDPTAKPRKRAAKRTDVAAGAAQVLANDERTVQSRLNAETTAQPGIIADIMSILSEAKAQETMLTANGIGDKLAEKYPERKLSGMMVTVRAQLSRLPRERNFPIHKLRDGHVKRYAAA